MSGVSVLTASIEAFMHAPSHTSLRDELLLSVLSGRDGWPLLDSAGALVLGVDPDDLSQEGRLAAIAVAERLMAAVAAAQAGLIAKVAEVERAEWAAAGPGGPAARSVDDPERELVAQALGVSPRTAAARVAYALQLVHRLPDVHAAQRDGRVTASSARMIVDETACLSVELAREVAARVLPAARRDTPGQVRRRTALLCARIDPVDARQRHCRARADRGVWTYPEADGMASLWWRSDAASIAAARDAIDAAAARLVEAGAHAGLDAGVDAARSDALGLLLSGADSGDTCSGDTPARRRRRPVIAVHVGLSTLVGADERPAEVPGLGFIPADAARQIALDADWQAFVHAADGRLAAVGSRAYTPTDAMAALVVARDRTCRFPGCAEPAHHCDIDHVLPYDHQRPEAGGPTHPDNLQALCRRHHNLKTAGTWSVRHTTDHASEWAGPRGRRVHVEHDPDPPW